MIKQTFGLNDSEQFSFGIIGLHPCGDLASILIDFFIKCKEAKFINVVGCCYMKLTCQEQNYLYEKRAKKCDFLGYPLSDFLLKSDIISSHIDYEAREIACHAIEKYTKRLSSKDYDYLRVHSFRAEIERIIQKYWPDKKHSGLKSIKKLTTFSDYCKQAVTHLHIDIPEHEINSMETERNLLNWKNVVIFYTLRLMLAPLVESVILYDRFLHILENGKQNFLLEKQNAKKKKLYFDFILFQAVTLQLEQSLVQLYLQEIILLLPLSLLLNKCAFY